MNLLEPSGPVQACKGFALPLFKVLAEDPSTYMLRTPIRFWLLSAPDSLESIVLFFDGFNVGWLSALPSGRGIKQIIAIFRISLFHRAF
jgi:hypothetical protein